jgi:hypothetical protein
MKIGDNVEVVYVDIFDPRIKKGDKASIVDIQSSGILEIFMESGERIGAYQVCDKTDIKLIT